MKDYRDIGIETYGDKCEICSHSLVEVHHINYQEQWNIERRLRKDFNNRDQLLKEARSLGFLKWDGNQLSKDDRSTNLAVLCGNCHTLIHKLDVGLNILKVLSKRK